MQLDREYNSNLSCRIKHMYPLMIGGAIVERTDGRSVGRSVGVRARARRTSARRASARALGGVRAGDAVLLQYRAERRACGEQMMRSTLTSSESRCCGRRSRLSPARMARAWPCASVNQTIFHTRAGVARARGTCNCHADVPGEYTRSRSHGARRLPVGVERARAGGQSNQARFAPRASPAPRAGSRKRFHCGARGGFGHKKL